MIKNFKAEGHLLHCLVRLRARICEGKNVVPMEILKGLRLGITREDRSVNMMLDLFGKAPDYDFLRHFDYHYHEYVRLSYSVPVSPVRCPLPGRVDNKNIIVPPKLSFDSSFDISTPVQLVTKWIYEVTFVDLNPDNHRVSSILETLAGIDNEIEAATPEECMSYCSTGEWR